MQQPALEVIRAERIACMHAAFDRIIDQFMPANYMIHLASEGGSPPPALKEWLHAINMEREHILGSLLAAKDESEITRLQVSPSTRRPENLGTVHVVKTKRPTNVRCVSAGIFDIPAGGSARFESDQKPLLAVMLSARARRTSYVFDNYRACALGHIVPDVIMARKGSSKTPLNGPIAGGNAVLPADSTILVRLDREYAVDTVSVCIEAAPSNATISMYPSSDGSSRFTGRLDTYGNINIDWKSRIVREFVIDGLPECVVTSLIVTGRRLPVNTSESPKYLLSGGSCAVSTTQAVTAIYTPIGDARDRVYSIFPSDEFSLEVADGGGYLHFVVSPGLYAEVILVNDSQEPAASPTSVPICASEAAGWYTVKNESPSALSGELLLLHI